MKLYIICLCFFTHLYIFLLSIYENDFIVILDYKVNKKNDKLKTIIIIWIGDAKTQTSHWIVQI